MKRTAISLIFLNLLIMTQVFPRGMLVLLADSIKNSSKPLLVSFRNEQVYRMDIATNEETPIFKPRYKWHQVLTVSPNDTLFAFIEKKPGEFHSEESSRQGRYDVWPEAFIRVVSRNGSLLHTLEDGMRYTWSPDGNKIAFITFDIKDADLTYRYPTGLWIFDTMSGEKKKVAASARRIKWAEFDNNLYFTQYSAAVLRYNTERAMVESTVYRGIDFSPDGKYYFVPYDPVAERKRQIYNTDTNEILLNEHQLQFTQYVTQGAIIKIVDWIKKSNSYLLVRATMYEGPPAVKVSDKFSLLQADKGNSIINFIYDVETRQVIKEFERPPSKWIASDKVIVIERDKKIILEKIPDVH